MPTVKGICEMANTFLQLCIAIKQIAVTVLIYCGVQSIHFVIRLTSQINYTNFIFSTFSKSPYKRPQKVFKNLSLNSVPSVP